MLTTWRAGTSEVVSETDLPELLPGIEFGWLDERDFDSWSLGQYDHDLVTLRGAGGLIVLRPSTREVLFQGGPRVARLDRSEDGGFLVFADWEDNMYRFDYATFELSELTSLADGNIRGVAISPDLQHIAIMSTDKFVRIVDAVSGELVRKIPLENASDAFWNDHETLTVTMPNQGVATVSLNIDTVARSAVDNLTRGFTEEECIVYGLDQCPTTVDMVRSFYLSD